MTDEVLAFTEGKIGRLRLNRPRAIHALNEPMCRAMIDALVAWRSDPDVELVLLDHAPSPDGDPKYSRGFCAGGDVRAVAESGKGDGVAARAFFHTEYQLNHLLFTYAKPVVSFLDGIVMGGGVGIGLPARYRVATERTIFAMPEATIGLFPDVGGGWYLSRLPGRVGQYLALTGHRLDGAECINLGLASDYLTSDTLEDAKARIAAAPTEIEEILGDLGAPVPEAAIVAREGDINRLFESDRLEDIYTALETQGGTWGAATLATLKTKSPQTMKVSLRLLAEGRQMVDFAAEMAQEYAVGSRVVVRHDFLEGVRAVIVDKDNAPVWNPDTPEGVSDDLIDAIFAPLPTEEAWTPA